MRQEPQLRDAGIAVTQLRLHLQISGEDVLAGYFADRHDRRMPELPLDRDRVKGLPQLGQPAHEMNLVAPPDLLLDHLGRDESSQLRLAQNGRERGVVELGDDLGAQVTGVEP
jgi:hypothetical protein